VNTCPYCAKITKEAIREAFEKQKSLWIERVTFVSRWKNVGGSYWEATFLCSACGESTVVRIELIDEPDPADWWKK
jgi:hypothetical protein